jgi:hypothetical protein
MNSSKKLLMEKRNLCYYSIKCPWSKAFIKEISDTPWKNKIQFISVDPPNNQGLPKWLKKVPTLVIAGEPEPRTDSEVMNWLYEMKLQTNQQGGGGGSGGQQENSDIDGWNSTEHNSFTKNVGYSFNDSDTSVTGNGGTSIPGAFGFLGGANGVGDRASQDFNPGKTEQGRNKSKKEELFDKQMEEYQRSRNIGMPEQRRAM